MRPIDADKLILHLADYQLQESPGWGANGYGSADACNAIRECIEMAEAAPTVTLETGWIPISERLPEVDEEGCSDYILLSFANATIPCVGLYIEDERGGAFYDDDAAGEPLIKLGIIVNAWMPYPKVYREENE